jgi:hypothetical protein
MNFISLDSASDTLERNVCASVCLPEKTFLCQSTKNAVKCNYSDSSSAFRTAVQSQSEPFSGQMNTSSPDVQESREKVTLLQKWEGVVLNVGPKTFWARLVDLVNDLHEEEAEFPIDEIPPVEQEWLLPGNMFYWAIGYRDTHGQRRRESTIRFRRIASPSLQDAKMVEQEAMKIAKCFDWE